MRSTLLLGVAFLCCGQLARAETAADFLAAFEEQGRRDDPGFGGASAGRGEQFYRSRHGADWSCASCHGEPAGVGRHAVTGKPIEPLAPSLNPARFTRAATVEKWFRRNCNDVLGRACTAQEKSDVLAWLVTLTRKETR